MITICLHQAEYDAHVNHKQMFLCSKCFELLSANVGQGGILDVRGTCREIEFGVGCDMLHDRDLGNPITKEDDDG